MPVAALPMLVFLVLLINDPMTAQATPPNVTAKPLTGAQAPDPAGSADPTGSADPAEVSDPAALIAEANAVAREIQKRTREARKSGNILTELEAMRDLEVAYADHGELARGMLAQMLAVMTSRLGNYAEAVRYFDEVADPWDGTTEAAAVALEGYAPQNALQVLSDVADKAQVIMINEAHHVPEHRAFTLRLLGVLRKKGFTHFAAETLYESDTDLAARGYPVAATGSYTTEPVYGDLVRTALRLGYHVIAYESPPNGDPTHDRERGQATHLVERILKVDPKARILVHAGFSHINESGLLAGHAPMAAQFREITGIDPFTVEQTKMTARSAAEFEHPIYRQAVTRGWVDEPTLFRRDGGEVWSSRPGQNDATLFHPPVEYHGSRPLWLRLDGMRADVHLPEKLASTKKRLVAWAKSSAESADAVPVDQIEIVPGQPLPVLVLPPGDFTVVVEDAAGEQVSSFHTAVPTPSKGASP